LSRSRGRDRAASPRASRGNRPRKGRLLPSLAALAVGAATALGLAAPVANAGTYIVKTCDNGNPSTSGWAPISGGAGTGTSHSCGNPGGGFAASFLTTPGSYAGWMFTAPANTDIAGFSLYRAFALPQNQPYGTGVYSAQTHGSSSGAWGTVYTNYGGLFYSGVSVESAGGLSGQNQFSIRIDCGGGSSCSGIGDAGLSVGAADFMLRDNIDPVIVSPSGTLLANGALSGSRSITFSATDQGGGVFRSILLVDGSPVVNKVIDGNGGHCNTSAFVQTVPCKLAASDTLSLNTAALSEGTHSVQLIVRDATDTNQAVYGPFNINVDNVPPPVNTSAPLITGVARHGQTLTGDTGTWTGTGITFARQWQRYDAGTGTWTSIAGATGPTYAIQSADYGKALRMRSRATNSEGTVDAYSDPAGPIASPTDPKGDLDNDGIINENDSDIDGDGVPNDGDADPKDPSLGVPPADPTDPGTGVPAPGEGETGRGDAPGGNTGGGGSGAGGDVRIETKNGEGAVAAAALAATFSGTKSKTIKVKWGAKRKITGTLLAPNRQPIVGAKLEVHQTPQLMGSAAQSLGQVVTDAKGRFSYALPAGVSRTIRFGYKHILEASTYSQTTEVNVQVTPKVTMKADRKSLRNKHAVTFKGKITGAPAGVRKIVEFQALDGKKWRTFASTRVAKKGGTFKYRYRFTRTTRPTNYQFRAIVRAEKGWPFASGQTKPIKVKVRR
jgi:hypothetical protein